MANEDREFVAVNEDPPSQLESGKNIKLSVYVDAFVAKSRDGVGADNCRRLVLCTYM
jgi:hypothetical protein